MRLLSLFVHIRAPFVPFVDKNPLDRISNAFPILIRAHSCPIRAIRG